MDRQAIARAQRRRQAVEALEFERARGEALQEQLETVVAELEGPALDEAVFATMDAGDVAIVRPALYGDELEPPEEHEEPGELADADEAGEADDPLALDWYEELEDEPEPDPAEREAEIARLEEELAGSRRRQLALERYLAALGG